MDIRRAALIRYLEKLDPLYYGKTLEIREKISGWLEYIPVSFSHYTRHTVAHSEEIIFQISHFIFNDDAGCDPTIQLSGAEVYILVAAAYLHDAGMVVTEGEKEQLLTSASWRDWTMAPDGPAHSRLQSLQDFRNGNSPDDLDVRNFLADLELRRLISEYFRRTHHERSRSTVIENEMAFGRVAFGDPELSETIADVCLGHGLNRSELDDRIRFPLVRQIRGENVNVRLLAVILRLGDLLDLHNSRACPMMQAAVGSLPDDSAHHWEYLRSIKHRAILPQSIEIEAETSDPDAHRILRDWCQWIEDEVRDIPSLLSGGTRHSNWTPPVANLSGRNPTIRINPSPQATFYVRDWRFYFNEESVLQHLISDVYDSPLSYVRELLQNSADATRCRVIEENSSTSISTVASPHHLNEDKRSRFPIKVDIRSVLDEEGSETHQIFTISDSGIGMSERVIEKHLLQIGKSYYQSKDFRERYKFVPTSRFGIGFLTVFHVSNEINIDTYPMGLDHDAVPLHLRLSGPKNYIVIEHGNLSEVGTSIQIKLSGDNKLRPGHLTKYVKEACIRVEFPIVVSDFGEISTIRRLEAEDLTFTLEDSDDTGGFYEQISIEHNLDDYDIFLSCLKHTSSNGVVDFTRSRYYEGSYLDKNPDADHKPLLDNVIGLHGITVSSNTQGVYSSIFRRSQRLIIDQRGRNALPNLNRTRTRSSLSPSQSHEEGTLECILNNLWTNLIKTHIENDNLPEEKGYYHKLYSDFPSCRKYLESISDTCTYRKNGDLIRSSMNDIIFQDDFVFITKRSGLYRGRELEFPSKAIIDAAANMFPDTMILTYPIVCEFSGDFSQKIFFRKMFKPVFVKIIDEKWCAIFWERNENSNTEIITIGSEEVFLLDLDNPETWCISFSTSANDTDNMYLLNRRSSVINYFLSNISENNVSENYNKSARFLNTLKLIVDCSRFYILYWQKLKTNLEAWNSADENTNLSGIDSLNGDRSNVPPFSV